jgi:hypothetical protein
MATNASITSNYVGKEAGGILSIAFKETYTLSKGIIGVIPNITHGKGYLRRIQGTNGLQNYSCSWTPSGTLTLDEKVLEPKKLMINQEFCKEDFTDLWDSDSMGFSAWNDDLPKDEKEAILARILDELSVSIDTNIWNGSGTTAGQFQGLLPRLKADSDVIKIAAFSGAVTASIVVAEIQKIYDAIPQTIFTHPDLKICVSADVFRAYVSSQANLGYNNQYNNQNNDVAYFNTVAIQVLPELPAKTMVAFVTGQNGNFKLGTALTANFNNVVVKDMTETDLTDLVRVKVVFAADTNYAWGGEVVLYS